MSANILVVDDEPAVRETLGDWLQAAGYRCQLAAAADEALERARGTELDVALLDLAMPGQDGVWLARRLRERQKDVALIMCTGWQSFDAAVEGMRIGVNDYLLKPFSRIELVEAVQRALKWRQDRRRADEVRDDIAQAIAAQTAIMAEAFRHLSSTSLTALDGTLATVAARNPDAVEHARRVASFAVALGEGLRLPAHEAADVHVAALLHDVGKLAMPDALMLKPDALSESEIRVIRTHPRVAYDVLSGVPGLSAVAQIVLASHEAWDGSGYPRGLEGDAIPIGSRIIAVADTFDALTWSRAHRSPVSHARAAAELVRCAGTHFDPRVVQAWLRVLDSSSAGSVH